MIKYGLRDKKTGLLVGFRTRENPEGCEGTSTTYSLYKDSDRDWLVETPENAEYVRLNSTEWYNAGFETPENEYDPDELEVVRVEQVISVKPVDVKVPTIEEYFKRRYLNKDLKHYNPKHYEYCMKDLKRLGPDNLKYSIYDLRILEFDEAELLKRTI